MPAKRLPIVRLNLNAGESNERKGFYYADERLGEYRSIYSHDEGWKTIQEEELGFPMKEIIKKFQVKDV